jgi:hypothetical protein
VSRQMTTCATGGVPAVSVDALLGTTANSMAGQLQEPTRECGDATLKATTVLAMLHWLGIKPSILLAPARER